VTGRFALAATFAAVIAGVVLGPAGWASQSGSAASRLVDRTVVCTIPKVGYPDGPRFMTVSALSERPALMGAANGPNFEVRVSVSTGPTARKQTGSVTVNRRDCIDTSVHVPLSARGLRGGPASRLGSSFKCDVPTRVLMRVRATFKRPTTWRPEPQPSFLTRASGQIATGYLAVASLRDRKPLAYAEVNGATGMARIYTLPSRCRRAP
jgi:hypothetical protein